MIATWLAVVLAPLLALAERGQPDGLADLAQGPLVWLLQKGLAFEGGGGPPALLKAAAPGAEDGTAPQAAEARPRHGTAEAAAPRAPYAVEIPGNAQLAGPAGPAAARAPPPALVPGLNASGRGQGHDGVPRLLSATAVSAGARLSQDPTGVVGAIAGKEWASRITKGSFVAKSSKVFVGRYDESVTAFERRWHEGRVLLVVFVMLLLWSHFNGPSLSPSPLDTDEDEVESRRDAPTPAMSPSAPGSVAVSRRTSNRPSRVPSRFGSAPPSRCHSPPRLPQPALPQPARQRSDT